MSAAPENTIIKIPNPPLKEYPLTVKFKLIHKDAKIERKTDGSSGYDVYAVAANRVSAHEFKVIPLGFALEIPKGFEAQMRCRSSLAAKGIFVVNGIGTVDSDYRGELGVILGNFSDQAFWIEPKDRIAQIVFSRIFSPTIEIVTELTPTARGEGKLGSTGK